MSEVMGMTDVMLDFETFGNGKNACVVQIGACFFDRQTGDIGDKLHLNVDAKSSVKSGADLDADTVYWWLSQSREAIESITGGVRYPIESAMTELNLFLEPAKQIWSHATFDFVILTETLKRLQIRPAFSYRAARDIRTLMDLANINPKSSQFVRDGIHHDALADCIFQIKYCVAALNKLKV